MLKNNLFNRSWCVAARQTGRVPLSVICSTHYGRYFLSRIWTFSVSEKSLRCNSPEYWCCAVQGARLNNKNNNKPNARGQEKISCLSSTVVLQRLQKAMVLSGQLPCGYVCIQLAIKVADCYARLGSSVLPVHFPKLLPLTNIHLIVWHYTIAHKRFVPRLMDRVLTSGERFTRLIYVIFVIQVKKSVVLPFSTCPTLPCPWPTLPTSSNNC